MYSDNYYLLPLTYQLDIIIYIVKLTNWKEGVLLHGQWISRYLQYK